MPTKIIPERFSNVHWLTKFGSNKVVNLNEIKYIAKNIRPPTKVSFLKYGFLINTVEEVIVIAIKESYINPISKNNSVIINDNKVTA